MTATASQSVTERIDTTTSGGKLVFHIFGALAEFERDIIKERTQAGLQAARTRGLAGGRRRSLTPKEIAMVRKLAGDKNTKLQDLCKYFAGNAVEVYKGLNRKIVYNFNAKYSLNTYQFFRKTIFQS